MQKRKPLTKEEAEKLKREADEMAKAMVDNLNKQAQPKKDNQQD
jgi:hypothetical protein